MAYRCFTCRGEFAERGDLLSHMNNSPACAAGNWRVGLAAENPSAVRCGRCGSRIAGQWHPSRAGFVCGDCLTNAEMADARRDVDAIRAATPGQTLSAIACAGLLVGSGLGLLTLCILKAAEVLG